MNNDITDADSEETPPTRRKRTPLGRYEVILVDDHSTDGLYNAIRHFDRCANFFYIRHSGPPGAGRARNTAIPILDGDAL